MKANNHIIHKEGAFIDCVNCTEWLLNGLAGLVTGLPDGEGHCHAVGSSECPEPVPETIIVLQEFDYGKMKFQNIADLRLFNVKDNLRRTLAYVTLTECKEQEPLLVRLPITNEIKGPNFAIHSLGTGRRISILATLKALGQPVESLRVHGVDHFPNSLSMALRIWHGRVRVLGLVTRLILPVILLAVVAFSVSILEHWSEVY